MGAILDTPHTEKTTDTGTGNDLRYGVCSMQGWRVEMEDAHCAKVGLPDLPEWSFFAVFDGHAGAYVSAHCAENLLDTILKTDSFLEYAVAASKISKTKCSSKTANGESSAITETNANATNTPTSNANNTIENNGGDTMTEKPLSSADSNNNNNKDEVTQTQPQKCDHPDSSSSKIVDDHQQKNNDDQCDSLEGIKTNIREAFLKLDDTMKSLPEVESGEDISGSTAVACLISPTHLFFANCGDSRAVMSCKGETIFSTQDHKPVNPGEKERIQAAGGSVMIQRVNGSLAVSRALGDYQYKQVCGRGQCEQLVSPEPEITIYKRDMENDEFLILACDGIWDVMTNDDLCNFVRHQLKIHSKLEDVCSSIIDTCLHKGSTDNMSVVLVTFKGAPTVCEEARHKDKELNRKIEKEVIRQLNQNSEFFNSIYLLMQSLKNVKFENLPPGGGLDAKRTFIESIQKRYVEEHQEDV